LANLLLKHPISGQSSYGFIEAYNARGVSIPSGKIYLKDGEHWGPNNGYGAAHIWAEHEKELRVVGFNSLEAVPAFVASIVQPGSFVYFESARMRGGQRVSIVRSKNGMAILEYKGTRGNPNYSVVTAYPKAKPHGTLVGTVR
jgi:hypothetical protein